MKKYALLAMCTVVLCVHVYFLGVSHATSNPAQSMPVPQRMAPSKLNGQAVPWGVATAKLTNVPASAMQNVVQIAVGDHHALAVRNDGRIVGWGKNLRGELTIPTNLGSVVSVSVGITHSVALRSNGSVAMWGQSASLVLSPTVTLPTDVVQIATGSRHTVMLRQNGTVVVAGGLARQRSLPADLIGKTIVAVAAGNDTSLALTNTGNVYAWGSDLTIPVSVQTNVVRIFASGGVFAALKTDGQVLIWGDIATVTPDASMTVISSATSGCTCLLMPNASAIRSVEVARWGIAIVRRTGQVLAMARSGYSIPSTIPDRVQSLGMHPNHSAGVALSIVESASISDTSPTPAPLMLQVPTQMNPPGQLSVWGGPELIRTVPVSATTSIIQVVAGVDHVVALRSDGRIVAWGDNSMNQTKVPAELLIARDQTSPLRVVMLAAGANHTLALRANGTVLAWGDNKGGQITGVATWTNVVQVTAGSRHSLALLRDGSIIGVGNNTFNQLNIPQISNVVKITTAANHNVALIRDGSMVAWGRNLYGQIDIPAEMRAVDVWAMYDNTVVLQRDGQIAVIGTALFDQDDVPAESFRRIGVGNYHVLGITKAGVVRAWGLDADDQLVVPDSLVSPYFVTGGSNFSVALSREVSNVPTTTATASRVPMAHMPVAPTSRPLIAVGGVTAWNLNTIPAVTGSDINTMAMTSDVIGIVRSNGNVTLNQSTQITPQSLPANAQTNVQHIALGNQMGAVIKRDYSLVVWGNAAPVVPARFLTHVADVSLAGDHMLIQGIDGKVWSNLFALDTLASVKHIAAGPTFAVILLNDGTVFVAAPTNDEGLLSVPSFSSAVSEIAAGNQHILALQQDGTLVAWGAELSDVGQADIPYEAMYNVVGIAASDQMSIALRNDNTVVAWGDTPANTATQLTTISTNKNAAAVVAGGGKLAVITNGAPIVGASATRTRIPSQTALVFPTTTARVMNNESLANMSGWFPMDGAESRLEYDGVVARYRCPNPYDCPVSDPNGMLNRAAQFRASRTDEIIGNAPIALGNKSFTVSYWLRRDQRDVEDVVFSMGAVAKIRQYLTMGIDQENRAYCSFFGDDLRSVEWFNDSNWHHYACTFNQTTRIRQLYRDGRLIAQDMVMSAVNIPSSAIMFGERYDNMAGLVGSLDNFVMHDRVLTATELQSYAQLPTQNRIETVSFDDVVFPGISPNRSVLLCVPNIPCPETINDTHNQEALLLTGVDQLQLNHPTVKLGKGFTLAYWAKRNTSDTTNEVVLSQGTSESMFVMGIYADQQAFCQINYTVLKSMMTTDNEWHHYACSYNRTNDVLTLYVDGVLIDSVVTTDYAGLGVLYVGRMNQNITNVRGLKGLVDDVMVYNAEVPPAVIRFIYNTTNPPVPIATLAITPNRTGTRTPTFTAVRLSTNTPRRGPSKTRLPATMTPNIAVVRTNTPTLTPTRTVTVNRTLIAAGTATFTASATATASNTRGPTTPTRTRTPLLMTRTMLAKLSPTWRAQTLTATYQSQAATNIAATATERAAASATRVAATHVAATLTAEPSPLPPTITSTAYPYP